MGILSKTARWAATTLIFVILTAILAPCEVSNVLVNAEVAGNPTNDPAVAAAGEMQEATGSTSDVDKEQDEDEPVVKGQVQILDERNFERLTQVATGATTGDWFIKFYAPWCGHCTRLEPIWNELAAKLGDQVNVGKVDVTENRSLGKRFGVKSFPTLLFFSHGNVHKYEGGRKLDALTDYAKGGFKGTKNQEVPKPRGVSGGVKEILEQLALDLANLSRGKVPRTESLMLLAVGILVFLVLLLMMLPSPKPAAPRRPKAD